MLVSGAADVRRGRWAFGLTVAAFAWAVALVVGAVLVPVYDVEDSSSGSSSATLVGENGLGVLLPVAFPVVVAAVVWVALHRKCSRGSRPAEVVAWVLVGVLLLGCMLAMLTIGIFVLPVAVLLAVAAVLTPLPE